ncbi:MAG: DUF4330 domain-containing protein [Bacillota bacterium]|nr:DUF4330 domain-containing protein [Bacillota bacterium]
MDKKGKLFGKISIIDLLIILVIIGAAAGITYKFTKSKVVSPLVKSDIVTMQFYTEEVPDYVANAVKKDTLAQDADRKVTFGTITDVKVDKSVSLVTNSQGQIIRTSKPGYSSILITVEAKAYYSNNGVSLGGNEYFIGDTFQELKFGNTSMKTTIYDLKKKG